MRTLVVNALRMCGERTAIGRHLEHLVQEWTRTDAPFDRIVLASPRRVELPRLGRRTRVDLRVSVGAWPNLFWEQLVLPYLARGAACLYSIYTSPVICYRGPLVVANHGIYEAIPTTFSRWQRVRSTPLHRRSVWRADRVIANSHSTKADLVRFFGIPATRVHVVYPGPAAVFFRNHDESSVQREVTGIFGHRVPYIIFVGKLVKRRNLPNLIAAFARVKTRYELPHRLLLVGPNPNAIDVGGLAAHHGVGPEVLHIRHLEHDVLARLYAGADLFVLPTEYEGLSRTMFEAMASGTPVVSVEHPALAEGGGGAVMALPSPSVDDLADGLTAMLGNPALRRAYAAKGRVRVARFSLQECAQATMALLDQVAEVADRA